MKPIIASETKMITSPDCPELYKVHKTITCNWYKLNILNCLEPKLRKWRTRPKTYKVVMFSWIEHRICIVCFSFNSKTLILKFSPAGWDILLSKLWTHDIVYDQLLKCGGPINTWNVTSICLWCLKVGVNSNMLRVEQRFDS